MTIKKGQWKANQNHNKIFESSILPGKAEKYTELTLLEKYFDLIYIDVILFPALKHT